MTGLSSLLSLLTDKVSVSPSVSTTLFVTTALSVSYIIRKRYDYYVQYILPYEPRKNNETSASSSSSSLSSNARACIADIHVYPVKGMRGHSVSQIEITPLGLLHDRRFVVVDINEIEVGTVSTSSLKKINNSKIQSPELGNFLTQRSHPRLATITPYIYTKNMWKTAKDTRDDISNNYTFPTTSNEGSIQYIRLSVDNELLPSNYSQYIPIPPVIDIPVITAQDLLSSSLLSSSSSSSSSTPSLPAGVSFRSVQVWNSTIHNCIDLGDKISNYLQYYINTNYSTGERIDKEANLRLMYQDPLYHTNSVRKLNTKYIPSWLIKYGFGITKLTEYFSKFGLYTSFSDGYPILLGSLVSLQDLNQRIQSRAQQQSTSNTAIKDPYYGKPITIQHFRPNIIVDQYPNTSNPTLLPWEEDTWLSMDICNTNQSIITLHGVKRCDRCLVTTTNPKTGERGTGEPSEREPLATLSSFRSSKDGKDKGIFFAINIIPELNTYAYTNFHIKPMIHKQDQIIIKKRGLMKPE